MAYVSKRNGLCCVNFKDINGKWKRTSCGKDTKRADAKALLRRYGDIEFNNRHKAPVKFVQKPLKDAIEAFHGILEKEHKTINSIRREQTSLNNYLEYVSIKDIVHFKELGFTHYVAHRLGQGVGPKTIKEKSE